MRRIVLLLAVVALFGAGFGTAVGADPLKKKKPHVTKKKKHKAKAKAKATTTVHTTPAVTTTAAPAAFPAGIYYMRPALDHPGGTLQLLNGTLPAAITAAGITGWDLNDHEFVWADQGTDDVHIVSPSGSDRVVHVQGLYAIGRPSLSPDGSQIAVQATETPVTPSAPPQFFTVYVINLADGTWRRLVPPNSNPTTGNELPEWLPTGGVIAHQGIGDYALSPEGMGCDIFRIVDAASGAEKVTIRNDGTTGCYRPARGVLDGPRFHIALTRDGTKLLVVGQMRTYDAATGALLSDIHDSVLAALAAAGYAPDSRFPGQGGGGTFPLDGSFSPDGTQIVFDGAVQKDGSYGVLLMRVNVDGSGFTILDGPIQVTPQFSNNHNYSQLNPLWKR